MTVQPILTEGREIFRKLVALPDPMKNGPAPNELQDRFVRWRRKLLESRPLRTPDVLNTAEPYVGRLTVRLLAYYLERLLEQANREN